MLPPESGLSYQRDCAWTRPTSSRFRFMPASFEYLASSRRPLWLFRMGTKLSEAPIRRDFARLLTWNSAQSGEPIGRPYGSLLGDHLGWRRPAGSANEFRIMDAWSQTRLKNYQPRTEFRPSGDVDQMKFDRYRRRLFKGAMAFAATTLAGCWWESVTSLSRGGPSTDPAPPPSPMRPPAPATNPASTSEESTAGSWAPCVPALIVGSNGSFDLNTTLPLNIKRGGIFEIDASGPPLPAGMSLTSTGILAVGTAAIGTVTGVVFTYDAP